MTGMAAKCAAMAVGLAYAGFGAATAARADLKLCNKTESKVGVAIGYKTKENWISEGWWNIGPNGCEVLLKGKLVAKYYYVYAVDYDKGGSWSGQSILCAQEKLFTIKGIDDCEKRGFKRYGFWEVDTGEQADWTVSLDGESTQAQQQ